MRLQTGYTLAATLTFLAGSVAATELAGNSAETLGTEQQIAGAIQAAPEDRREGATVMGYSANGELQVLRQGTNEIVCIADRPGDDKFRVACYHESLEAYMIRGRELREEGVEGAENLDIRHQEADDGKLEMPSDPAALYNLGGPAEIFDPKTGEVTGGNWVWSIYTPYATETSTGLPTGPQAPGGPWIMRPGTASSHIMVVQPREEKPSN